jgi:hypothetical protein
LHVGAKPPKPADKKPAAPAKPLQIHVFVVPDGARTWIGIGGDEAITAARLAATLGSAGEKLGARADLAALKDARIGSGGFFTARGLPETAQQVSLLGNAGAWGASEVFDEAAQMPHQGLSPIVFTTAIQAGATPATVVARIQVPRDAIEDVVTTVLKHGGF